MMIEKNNGDFCLCSETSVGTHRVFFLALDGRKIRQYGHYSIKYRSEANAIIHIIL